MSVRPGFSCSLSVIGQRLTASKWVGVIGTVITTILEAWKRGKNPGNLFYESEPILFDFLRPNFSSLLLECAASLFLTRAKKNRQKTNVGKRKNSI